MKRSLLTALAVAFISVLGPPAASAATVDLYLFWGEGCPHCRAEMEALPALTAQFPELRINALEIYSHPGNVKLLQRVGETLGIDIGGVPLTIVGGKSYTGFSPDITPAALATQITACLRNGCEDPVAPLLRELLPSSVPPEDPLSTLPPSDGLPTTSPDAEDTTLTLPLIGTFDARTVSLPLLAVIMGILDGFNPCAMWTLLFLLSLLIGVKHRGRRWALGTTFIVASAAVYFFFMAAWLQLMLFLGFILWVRLGMGALALAGGGWSLWKAARKETGCAVEGDERRERIFVRLRRFVQEQHFWLAIVGIVALAFAVNLVELICSAGLPALFTQVLALNAVSPAGSYGLITLYIVFFMLDDLIVFFGTMVTLEMTGITTRYARASRMMGGALLVAIGLLLLLKPEWLFFG